MININYTWNSFFTNEKINIYKNILKKIGDNYYPEEKDVLKFAATDFNNIKCVILGMDPYPSDYITVNGIKKPIATGRSFEVANVTSWNDKFKQASLRNILKTIYFNETGKIQSLEKIRNEIANGNFEILPPPEWFDSLEKQGVLFLNTSLTVAPGKPLSHEKVWEAFTKELIKYIDFNRKNEITWFLWGNKAKSFKKYVEYGKIIETMHPRCVEFIEQNCFASVKNINWIGK